MSEYLEVDVYYGELTLKFKTQYGIKYIKPDRVEFKEPKDKSNKTINEIKILAIQELIDEVEDIETELGDAILVYQLENRIEELRNEYNIRNA